MSENEDFFKANIYRVLICARCYSKHFKPHTSVILPLFYGCRNQTTEKLGSFPRLDSHNLEELGFESRQFGGRIHAINLVATYCFYSRIT